MFDQRCQENNVKHKIILILSFYIKIATSPLPDAELTMRFRGWLFSLLMKKAGKNFQVAEQATLRGLENLSVGDNVYIGPNATFLLREGCTIGDNVLIGPNCVISDANHGFDGRTYRFARGQTGSVFIGEGAWITSNVVITRGASIEPSSVVRPNQVVSLNTRIE